MSTVHDADAYLRWATPRLVAELWWCGDEVCDCTQPQIVRVSPGVRYPWVKCEIIWEGRFLTDTADYQGAELEELQFAPFRAACREYEVTLPETVPEKPLFPPR